MATRARRQYQAVFPEVLAAKKVIDMASIATGAQNTANTVTVPGAALGDNVQVSCSISQAGVGLQGYVSAADTVTILATNASGGAIDLASATYYVIVEKLDPLLFL